MSEMLYV